MQEIANDMKPKLFFGEGIAEARHVGFIQEEVMFCDDEKSFAIRW